MSSSLLRKIVLAAIPSCLLSALQVSNSCVSCLSLVKRKLLPTFCWSPIIYSVTLFCRRNTFCAHIFIASHICIFKIIHSILMFVPLTVTSVWCLPFLIFPFYTYFFSKIHCGSHCLRSINPSVTGKVEV